VHSHQNTLFEDKHGDAMLHPHVKVTSDFVYASFLTAEAIARQFSIAFVLMLVRRAADDESRWLCFRHAILALFSAPHAKRIQFSWLF